MVFWVEEEVLREEEVPSLSAGYGLRISSLRLILRGLCLFFIALHTIEGCQATLAGGYLLVIGT